MLKKLTLMGIAAMLAFAVVTVNAEEAAAPEGQAKKLCDWLTATSWPTTVHPGETAVFKVKLTGVAAGDKLGADMHFFHGPSYGGFLVWHPALSVEDGKELVFSFKVPEKEGMTGVGVVFYVGKQEGWGNKEKEVWLKGVEVK